jgi:hypothetical protein
MKVRTTQYGGIRPICTGSALIGVPGGFNLDLSKVKISVGALIPGGSLAQYDEKTRLVTVLKASRVTAISVQDAKIVNLESDEFTTPIFSVGDSVLKTVSGTFANAPTITKITNDKNGFVITLSEAIGGLTVGDALFQVITDGDANASLPIDAPQGLTIAEEPLGTPVRLDETSVDVSIGTNGHQFYFRRIPPIPAQFISGICLETNPNILFTDSY